MPAQKRYSTQESKVSYIYFSTQKCYNSLMFKKFVFQNIVNVLASIAIGLGNWLFAFLIIKYTSPELQTSFFGFMAFSTIFSFPGVWITLMTIKLGGTLFKRVSDFWKKYRLATTAIAIIAFVTLAILFVSSGYPVFLYALLLAFIFMGFTTSYFRGLLQRNLSFARLGLIGIIEVGLKIGVLVALLWLKQPSLATYGAVTLQTVFTTVVLFILVKSDHVHTEDEVAISKTAILTLFYSVCFLLITNVDLIFAKRNLPLDQNAKYIALLQIGKLVIFGSSALISVLLPALQKYKSRLQTIQLSIFTALGVLAGGAFVAIVSFIEYPLMQNTFGFKGVDYQTALLLLVAVITLGIAQIPLVICLIRERKALPFVVIITAIVQILSYVLFGTSLYRFVLIYGLTGIVLGITATGALIYKPIIHYFNKSKHD